jgi:tetratricopeptide (TPR) repeat protein
VSRNFSNSASARTANFNRGGNNSFNRGNFSNFNRSNFGGNFKNNNFNNHNYNNRNFNSFNNRGWGYGGWGGYGRSGFYPYGFGFYPGFGLWGLGWWPWWGIGYGGWGGYGGYYGGYPANYGGYGNGYNSNATTYYADATGVPAIDPAAAADDFVEHGEQAFRAGNYQDAIRNWQHAMVDDPNNGGVMLLVAQALFALGQYGEAAGGVQMAMQLLPENEWGTIGKNYSQLYGNIGDYTAQLKALEKARDAKPDDPALRFLLGYHFGSLNYPNQAVRELDKALDLEPKDLGAQKLRDVYARQGGLPARPAANPDAAPAGPAAPAPPNPEPPDEAPQQQTSAQGVPT